MLVPGNSLAGDNCPACVAAPVVQVQAVAAPIAVYAAPAVVQFQAVHVAPVVQQVKVQQVKVQQVQQVQQVRVQKVVTSQSITTRSSGFRSGLLRR